jgi:nicotinamide-nucleotide amidase
MSQRDEPQLAARVGDAAQRHGRSVAVAESLTGGLVASHLAAAPGASAWFRGGIVAYASEVKHRLLDVPPGPVVCEPAARAMAEGAARLFGADVTLALTGVGGPEPQDGQPPGEIWFALHVSGTGTTSHRAHLDGSGPAQICQSTAVAALHLLLDACTRPPGRIHP